MGWVTDMVGGITLPVVAGALIALAVSAVVFRKRDWLVAALAPPAAAGRPQ
jgi:hypothetical protein